MGVRRGRGRGLIALPWLVKRNRFFFFKVTFIKCIPKKKGIFKYLIKLALQNWLNGILEMALPGK